LVTAAVVLTLVACLVAASIVSRGIRLIDYTSVRSRGGLLDVITTLLGTLVGGFMFFGLPAIGYEAGLAGVGIGVGYAFGLLLVARYSRTIKTLCEAHQLDTIDDLIAMRFGRAAQFLSTFINLVVFLGILAAQIVAFGAFLELFTGVDFYLTLNFAVVIVTVYTSLAGFRGVLLTDIWQAVILAVSAMTIFTFVSGETPPAALKLDPRGPGYGVSFLFGAVVLFPFSILCRSDIWQRVACARDAAVAKKAFTVAAPIVLVFYILLTSLGIFAAAKLGPSARPETAGLQNFLNVVAAQSMAPLAADLLTTLVALGVLASLLSTSDSYLNLVSVSLSKVLRAGEWRAFENEQDHPRRSPLEASLLRTTRIVCILLGVAAYLIAISIPDIIKLIVGAMSVLFVLLPSVMSALRADALEKHSLYPPASVSSILAGMSVYVLSYSLLSEPKTAFLPATAVSAVVFLGVSRWGASRRQESA